MNPIPCAVKGQDNIIVLCIDIAFVPMMTLMGDKPMLVPNGVCLVTQPELVEGKETGKTVTEFATIPLPNLQPLVAFGPQVQPAPVVEAPPSTEEIVDFLKEDEFATVDPLVELIKETKDLNEVIAAVTPEGIPLVDLPGPDANGLS